MYKQQRIYSIVITLLHLILGTLFLAGGIKKISQYNTHVEPFSYALIIFFFVWVVSSVEKLIKLFNKLITSDALKKISIAIRLQSFLVFIFIFGGGIAELSTPERNSVFGNNGKIMGVIFLILALVELTYIIYISLFIKKVSKLPQS